MGAGAGGALYVGRSAANEAEVTPTASANDRKALCNIGTPQVCRLDNHGSFSVALTNPSGASDSVEAPRHDRAETPLGAMPEDQFPEGRRSPPKPADRRFASRTLLAQGQGSESRRPHSIDARVVKDPITTGVIARRRPAWRLAVRCASLTRSTGKPRDSSRMPI